MAEDLVPPSDDLRASQPPTQAPTRPRLTLIILLAALAAGAVLGTFEIANTGIGWHLASGRWIVENRGFLRSDPFSFTAAGVPWIDHEWLFQVGVALARKVGGAPALVALRALLVAVMAALLLGIGVRSRLGPPTALLLSVLCVWGARPRFFMRPELVSLLLVPAVVWIFLRRDEQRSRVWLVALAGLMVVGANAHGAVLVVPFLLAAILAAEVAQMAITRCWRRQAIVSGMLAVLAAASALLVNPYGWRLLTVPFRLTHLVGQPHVPNPEWISPTPAQAPALYIAIVCGLLLLALGERRAGRWVLFFLTAALALRHVRNLGLFFVLLPLAVAPAMARWALFRDEGVRSRSLVRRSHILAVVAALVLAVSVAVAPWPRFGFGFAPDFYPEEAADFLDREGLPASNLYNDVRFGGYLIDRYFPPRQVFQDDRNEINEPLLREIWEIFQRSDVDAWDALMTRFEIDTALVRYHPSIRVTTPNGRDLGLRGFSALWFPRRSWALVYWDDIAMVLVRRASATQGLLERHEYRVVRPDDLDHLEERLLAEPELRPLAAAEVRRALDETTVDQRARRFAAMIARMDE